MLQGVIALTHTNLPLQAEQTALNASAHIIAVLADEAAKQCALHPLSSVGSVQCRAIGHSRQQVPATHDGAALNANRGAQDAAEQVVVLRMISSGIPF